MFEDIEYSVMSQEFVDKFYGNNIPATERIIQEKKVREGEVEAKKPVKRAVIKTIDDQNVVKEFIPHIEIIVNNYF